MKFDVSDNVSVRGSREAWHTRYLPETREQMWARSEETREIFSQMRKVKNSEE